MMYVKNINFEDLKKQGYQKQKERESLFWSKTILKESELKKENEILKKTIQNMKDYIQKEFRSELDKKFNLH